MEQKQNHNGLAEITIPRGMYDVGALPPNYHDNLAQSSFNEP